MNSRIPGTSGKSEAGQKILDIVEENRNYTFSDLSKATGIAVHVSSDRLLLQ